MEHGRWSDSFVKKYGRLPRILHMGNIANNAYQNAKMLNQAGCDCDVICYDYYHCMGCPEWDDADYEGDIGDPFYPAWHKVKLHGFNRPRWFAQAPMPLATKYLIAHRDGKTRKANRLWKKMTSMRRSFAKKHDGVYREKYFLAGFQGVFHRFSHRIYLIIHYVLFILRTFFYYIRALGRAFRLLITRPSEFWYKFRRTVNRWMNRGERKKNSNSVNSDSLEDPPIPPDIVDVYQMALDDFKLLFPERESHIEEYLVSYIYAARDFLPLLQRYDVVEAYAHCPIIPYLAGYENYVAFEHGTIRDFPQDDNGLTQLAMLAYAKAKAIYITNVDCVPSAEYIVRNTNVPIIYGLHGLDINRIARLQDAAQKSTSVFSRMNGAPIFFCPSRHTFDRKKGLFLKGEDMAIRAAAQLHREGHLFHLVLVDWGEDTQMIKEIIAGNPGLESCVSWILPLKKPQLYQAYFAVDAVIDQFYLKGFGGIDFEVLCAGSAALISSKPDPKYLRKFFTHPLPYYGCDTEEEIYAAMREVIVEPEKARAKAQEGKDWISACHSSEMIVAKNLQAYAYCKDRS